MPDRVLFPSDVVGLMLAACSSSCRHEDQQDLLVEKAALSKRRAASSFLCCGQVEYGAAILASRQAVQRLPPTPKKPARAARPTHFDVISR